MMSYFSSLLFAVSASLDAFIVGITYGIRKIRITLPHNLLVSLITLAGTVLSICLGRFLSPLLTKGLAAIAGSAILIGMGAYYLMKFLFLSLRKRRRAEGCSDTSCCPSQCSDMLLQTLQEKNYHVSEADISATEISDINAPAPVFCLLTRRELLLMGIALSANNMGIGVGASIAGLPLLSASVCTFFCSVCFLLLGNLLGKAKLLQTAGRYSEPLSGLLLIGLGIYELL